MRKIIQVDSQGQVALVADYLEMVKEGGSTKKAKGLARDMVIERLTKKEEG